MNDGELKAILLTLVETIDAERAINARFREEMHSFRTEMLGFRTEMHSLRTETQAELRVINARLEGIDRRLDDQNRVLAALIPTRIAAVPPAAE